MKATLIIQDLTRDIQLDAKEMSAVRGGQGNQANGTSQSNVLSGMACSNIGNGSIFAGSGPISMQGDSHLDQTASNTNYSDNVKALFAVAVPGVLGD